MGTVGYALRDHVAHIGLAGAAGTNPIDQSLVDSLGDAVRRARADDAHVVVIEGSERAFSVGGDVAAFAAARDIERSVDDLAESLHRVISELHRMDAIVVSAVRGVAAGAGVALAAAADVVLAGSNARFTLAYTKIGFSPDGGTSLLTASIGLHRAMWLALANPVLTAEEAHAMGLVSQVIPDGRFEDAVADAVGLLRAGSRAAQVATKRLLRETATPGAEVALRRESLSIRTRASSPDGAEGIAAFLDKRVPRFPGNG
ncbi:enoyl-CoA hydratase-related protein [Nocardia sp. NPDC052254]|uniref:enoyl-CoA hydratase-related protein n=1 Tax=Nocardia sp. NPDC052254 TaxID=3155681 RepID=UPI003413A114